MVSVRLLPLSSHVGSVLLPARGGMWLERQDRAHCVSQSRTMSCAWNVSFCSNWQNVWV